VHNRLRLMMGATALLYLGPLLAGLGGFGWSQVPVFVGIFMLWLIILRPQQWPTTLEGWKKPEALVTLAAQVATQTLLVAVCFGIGRGIGGVAGFALPLPVLLPIGLSLLSIPLCRLIWDPWKAAQLDSLLDDAIAALETGRPLAGPGDDAVQMALEMLKPVAALPADTPVAELEAHLDALARHLDHETLAAALRSGPAPLRRALIVHASQPGALRALEDRAYPVQALTAAAGDAALLDLLARRLVAALREVPGAIGDYPTPERVLAVAEGLGDPAAEAALQDLAAAMRPLLED
jgi:hypothetical protein